MTIELKGENERLTIRGNFNVIVTCNSALLVYLDGAEKAWSRRLVLILYQKPPPANPIPNLARILWEQEASGILNWMLEGYEEIKADGWVLKVTPDQQRRADDMLLGSQSPKVFATECLEKNESGILTQADCVTAYRRYCAGRGWKPFDRAADALMIAIADGLDVSSRNDIPSSSGKDQRGWKGIRLKSEPPPDRSDSFSKLP